ESTEIAQLSDGRVLAILCKPFAEGGLITTHQDVTELHRAEQEAKQAHRRLRAVIEAMPAGLVIYDAEDRLVVWNRHQDEMFPHTKHMRVPGLKWEDMIRAGVASGQYVEAIGREEEWLKRRISLHAQKHAVSEERMSNGRWLRHEQVRSDDGTCVSVRVDITESKKRELELRDQNLRFDAALCNMSQGLSMFDRDRKLVV